MSITAEQAIKRIENHIRVHHIGQIPHIYIGEALDLALEALREKAEREDPKPLTLEELRRMDGEPVWIDDWWEDSHGWELSMDASDYFEGERRTEKDYGGIWVAYRHKPKEATE